MKTSLQFFKDMGVCDGAYAFLEQYFRANAYEIHDYLAGYNLLQTLPAFYAAAENGGPDHDTVEGWLTWAFDLRNRPEAIMYFGDHVEENLFRTADGQTHESLEAAQDYDRRRYAELKADHAAARVINGVRFGEGGAETWEVVDPTRDDLTGFDAFVWHDSTTGLNHRTESLAEAMAFDAQQAGILEAIDAAEAAARIERRIRDESGEFAVLVVVDKSSAPGNPPRK